jgi:hypothetical protein
LQSESIKSYLFTLFNQETMDIVSPIHMPLFNNLQSPLSNAPFSPLLPLNKHPNKHFNKYPDKYSDGDMDYLNNKLNSNTIKAHQPSFDKPSPIHS